MIVNLMVVMSFLLHCINSSGVRSYAQSFPLLYELLKTLNGCETKIRRCVQLLMNLLLGPTIFLIYHINIRKFV